MFNYRFDVIFIPQKVYLDWFWESIYTLYTPSPSLATPLEPTPHTLSVMYAVDLLTLVTTASAHKPLSSTSDETVLNCCVVQT